MHRRVLVFFWPMEMGRMKRPTPAGQQQESLHPQLHPHPQPVLHPHPALHPQPQLFPLPQPPQHPVPHPQLLPQLLPPPQQQHSRTMMTMIHRQEFSLLKHISVTSLGFEIFYAAAEQMGPDRFEILLVFFGKGMVRAVCLLFDRL